MIPEYLSIEGLYSYQQKQEIDFSKLISNNLFGIFGAVGSGKSSILEAIVLALYGESDRLGRQNRAYNLMNLQSDRLLIDLVCWAGKEGKEKFRFIYEAKRNSKKFEDVKTPNRRVFKWDGQDWAPLDNWDATRMIGMSYEHFCKTVIIPQGKFREFIELKPKDRTELLQDLFHLHDYDLSDRTSRLLAENKTALSKLEGELLAYQEVTEERSAALWQQIAEWEANWAQYQQQVVDLEKEVEEGRQLQELTAQKKRYLEQQKHLLAQKEEIEQQKIRLERYQEAQASFSEKLKQLKKQQADVSKKETVLLAVARESQLAEERQKRAETAFGEAEKAFQEKEPIAKKCEELARLIQMVGVRQAADRVASEEQAAKRAYEAVTGELEKGELGLQQAKAEVQRLREGQQDVAQLKDAEQWWRQKAELAAKQADADQREQQFRKQFAQKQTECGQVWARQLGTPPPPFTEMATTLQAEKEQRRTARLQAQQALKQAQHGNQAALVAPLLVEGEPCPVCGATHHPAPNSGAMAELAHLEQAYQEAENRWEALVEAENQIGPLRTQAEALAAQGQEWAQQREAFRQALAEHLTKQPAWPQADSLDAVLNLLKAQQVQQQQLQKAEQLVGKIEAQLQQDRQRQDTLRQQWQTVEKEKIRLDEHWKAQADSLVILKPDLVAKGEQELTSNLEKGKAKLVQIDADYQNCQQQLQQAQVDAGRAQQNLLNEQEQLRQAQQELTALQGEIDQDIVAKGFQSMQYLVDLLGKDWNLPVEKSKIETYYQHLFAVNEGLQTVENSLQNRLFDLEAFQLAQQKKAGWEKEREMAGQQIAVLKNHLSENARMLEAKQQLLVKQQVLTTRQENLQTLGNLFRGKGFVEYVSSVYLKDLVQAANRRFLHLSRNTLGLELNQELDFEVKDYLNNGKNRSIKTLSGGQTFQVALCLALALAENIKNLNQSEQSFFFLDEGFGALDRQSLATVFETLRTLKQENRIVGIISHVEELQQEIEVALLVSNDPEKGTCLRYSW